MTAARIGFGLLGAGVIAPTHANALRAADAVDFIAVADLDAARRDRLAREFGCRSCPDLEALLADPAVEAVNISLPNQLHFSTAMACIRAGRHVLVEKPPALSLHEIDTMAAAAVEAGVKVGVILQSRTRRTIQRLRQAVVDGRFGTLYQADVYIKWYRPAEYYTGEAWRQVRQAGAGVTIQQAIHYIDTLQFCVGPARRVQARMHNLGHPEVDLEDTMTVFTDFAGGARGVIQASTAFWPGTEVRLELNGSHGAVALSGDRVVRWEFAVARPDDAEMQQEDPTAARRSTITHAVADYSGHLALVEDLVDAIRHDRPPQVDLPSVRPTMEWVFAMYQSAKYDRPVDIPVSNPDDIW